MLFSLDMLLAFADMSPIAACPQRKVQGAIYTDLLSFSKAGGSCKQTHWPRPARQRWTCTISSHAFLAAVSIRTLDFDLGFVHTRPQQRQRNHGKASNGWP